jgi:hypothetical protein
VADPPDFDHQIAFVIDGIARMTEADAPGNRLRAPGQFEIEIRIEAVEISTFG